MDFVQAVACLMTVGQGWSRDYILCLSSRLLNNCDNDGAGII